MKSRNDQTATGDADGDGPVRRLVRIGCVAILVLRSLLPTEGTSEGDTVLLAQASLLLGLLWVWSLFREPNGRIRLIPFDAALAALVGWQFVSAMAVVLTGDGNARAALNVGWEWVAVGVVYFVARQVFDERAEARRLCVVLCGLTVALAALGIWQSTVEIPSLREQYIADRDEIDRLVAVPPDRRTPGDSRRLRELVSAYEAQGVPIGVAERRAFEQRLLHSSEPLGRFALANTFAGWMLPGAFLLVGFVILAVRRGMGIPRLLPVFVGLGLVLFCLLLTKSRTAYAGAAAGAIAVTAAFVRGRHRPRLEAERSTDDVTSETGSARSLVVWGGMGLLVVGLASGIVFAFGGLDAEVVSQSPRSLQFRLQYWGATLDVVRDRPVLGTGPGNFRQHYTRYKWPEASEEIADPHNLLFDVWATAGTPALLALLAALVLAGKALWRALRDEARGPFVPSPRRFDDAGLGLVLGFAALAIWQMLIGQPEWVELALLLTIAYGFTICLDNVSNASRLPVVGLAGGVIALSVHLLGAGGIAMPAIQSLLLMLLVAATWERSEGRSAGAAVSAALGVLIGSMFVACLISTTIPVLGSGVDAMSARAERVDGRLDLARKALERAVDRDAFAPDAASALAVLEFEAWQSAARPSESRLRSAIRWQEEAIRRDPRSASRRSDLAAMLANGFERVHEVGLAERAVEEYRAAIALYPTRATTHAELALLLGGIGEPDEAAAAARTALELDDVNREAGHVDRLLTDDVADRLRHLREADSGR